MRTRLCCARDRSTWLGPAAGDAAHQPGQLLRGAERPRSQQVESVLLGAIQLDGESRFQLLSGFPPWWLAGGKDTGPPGPGVGFLGFSKPYRRRSASSDLHQPICPIDDGIQGYAGYDLHGRVVPHAGAALLPDYAPMVSGQQFLFGGDEGGAVLHRVAQGADGPSGGLVGVGQDQGHSGGAASRAGFPGFSGGSVGWPRAMLLLGARCPRSGPLKG